MKDATCPAIPAGLQAAERGVPWMPVAGIFGSDLLAHRAQDRRVGADACPGPPTALPPDNPTPLAPVPAHPAPLHPIDFLHVVAHLNPF